MFIVIFNDTYKSEKSVHNITLERAVLANLNPLKICSHGQFNYTAPSWNCCYFTQPTLLFGPRKLHVQIISFQRTGLYRSIIFLYNPIQIIFTLDTFYRKQSHTRYLMSIQQFNNLWEIFSVRHSSKTKNCLYSITKL